MDKICRLDYLNALSSCDKKCKKCSWLESRSFVELKRIERDEIQKKHKNRFSIYTEPMAKVGSIGK